MANIRTYFSSLGLLFKSPENQVRIIAGSEEGLSGWISANILFGQIYPIRKPSDTYAVLDMGGMSMKIDFFFSTGLFRYFFSIQVLVHKSVFLLRMQPVNVTK